MIDCIHGLHGSVLLWQLRSSNPVPSCLTLDQQEVLQESLQQLLACAKIGPFSLTFPEHKSSNSSLRLTLCWCGRASATKEQQVMSHAQEQGRMSIRHRSTSVLHAMSIIVSMQHSGMQYNQECRIDIQHSLAKLFKALAENVCLPCAQQQCMCVMKHSKAND